MYLHFKLHGIILDSILDSIDWLLTGKDKNIISTLLCLSVFLIFYLPYF